MFSTVEGEALNLNGDLYFLGTIDYQYYDEFTDPVNLREWDSKIGTSSLSIGRERYIANYIYDKTQVKIEELTDEELVLLVEQAKQAWMGHRKYTDLQGENFLIEDSWRSEILGRIEIPYEK